jgi:hypothetical protein
MVSHFLVWKEERSIKHIMNSPVIQQSEPIGYWGDDLRNGKGAIAFWV